MKNRPVPDDGVIVQRARLAVAMALKKKRILGQPIAMFDPKTRIVYLEYGDGTCVEFGKGFTESLWGVRKQASSTLTGGCQRLPTSGEAVVIENRICSFGQYLPLSVERLWIFTGQ